MSGAGMDAHRQRAGGANRRVGDGRRVGGQKLRGRTGLVAAAVAVAISACGSSETGGEPAPGASGAAPEAGVAVTGVRVLAPAASDRSSFYATIRNDGDVPDTLLGLESTLVADASLHEMTMRDGMMGMSALEWIAVPAASSVELSPGGLHGMLEGLSESWEVGDSIPVTLRFAKAGPLTVWATVRDPADARGNH